jgi:hypothetical protein
MPCMRVVKLRLPASLLRGLMCLSYVPLFFSFTSLVVVDSIAFLVITFFTIQKTNDDGWRCFLKFRLQRAPPRCDQRERYVSSFVLQVLRCVPVQVLLTMYKICCASPWLTVSEEHQRNSASNSTSHQRRFSPRGIKHRTADRERARDPELVLVTYWKPRA